MEQVEHKNEDKMRVHKGKGIVALISVLDQIFAHNCVKEIKKELTNLNKGDEITWGDVRHIFKEHEDWAVSEPDDKDRYRIIKEVLAILQKEMFKPN